MPGLGLDDFSSLESLHRNPNPLDLATGEAHANALKIRTKGPLRVLNNVSSDPSALLRLTLASDVSSANGTTTSN